MDTDAVVDREVANLLAGKVCCKKEGRKKVPKEDEKN
jgi:hypothetical protein